MSLTNWNLWKFSFFRSSKYALSTPKRLQPCLIIREEGRVSLERLPLMTGYVVDENTKQAWAVLHRLKLPLEGFEEPVLLISERSFMPLDPLCRISADEKKRIQPLKNIAKMKYRETRSRISDENKKSQNARMMQTVLTMSFILVMILVVVLFIRGGVSCSMPL